MIQAMLLDGAKTLTQSRSFSPGTFNGGNIYFDFWVLPRPMTATWGSGAVWKRICGIFGTPDAAFGATDGIPEGPAIVDKKTGHDWNKLAFEDNRFEFGYWDPPYFVLDKAGKATLKPCLYKREGQEIWRTCRRLAVLHPYVWPTSWLKDAEREAMVPITMGPLKAVRLLQVFKRKALSGREESK